MLTGLMCVLLCGMAAEALAQSTVRVTAERTSLRDAAGTNGAIVGTVTKGEELTVIERSGTWYRVRTKGGAEGFVSSLLVEAVSGGAAPTAPAAAPAASAPPPAAAPAPTPRSAAPAPRAAEPPASSSQGSMSSGGSDYRTFGVGLASGGLAWGLTPSMRFWFSENVGLEVNASFLSGGSIAGNSYSVTAISPSIMVKFGEGWRAGTVDFKPYAGGGVTLWHYSSDFNDYYCNGLVDCDSSSLGLGGFGGVEVGFDAVPRLTASASVGFYTSPDNLGYAGLYTAIAAHWYFK